MRNLLLFLIKNKDHFVFVVALLFSFALLFNRHNDEMSVIRGFSSDFVSLLSTARAQRDSLHEFRTLRALLRVRLRHSRRA